MALTVEGEINVQAVWSAGGADVALEFLTVVLVSEDAEGELEQAVMVSGRTMIPRTGHGSLRTREAVRMGAPYTSRRGPLHRARAEFGYWASAPTT